MLQSAAHWDKIGMRPHKGVCLPLSALHTKKSGGIGEFLDLIPLIDWCTSLGMDVLQILPINDTGHEPSPYSALSSCALHPIYLSLYALPHLDDPLIREEIETLAHLNASERVDFQKVLSHKMNLLSLYFKQYGKVIASDPAFTSFIQKNSWLTPYALFKALQHQMDGASFLFWPDEFKYPTQEKYQFLLSSHTEEVSFQQVIQYLCYLQLKEVKKYANESGLFLKGDIPILISPNSADVWFHPELFNLDLSIGVPPDAYTKEGQNWGFPGLHWIAMKRDHFAWWKDRLAYAENFYDIYRIDHAVGLFRLWAIPHGKSALEGQFIPADENLWGPHGTEILEIFLKATSMLPIAEDLGLIPHVMRPILTELGIPGTKVPRWERDWESDLTYFSPAKYPKFSLTTISTHDSPTLEQWWRDYPEEAEAYANQKGWSYKPQITHTVRKAILKESNHSGSLFHINLLPEYLALVPEFVFPDPDHERINIPGTSLPSNWTYKFRKPLELITSSPLLKQEILSTL